MKLSHALATWGTDDFNNVFKAELKDIKPDQLPLQDGLSQSSYVSDSDINVMILNAHDTNNDIKVKVGVFYAGIIAGSCCSDDPTPVDEQTEYCDMQFTINKLTAETTVMLLG